MVDKESLVDNNLSLSNQNPICFDQDLLFPDRGALKAFDNARDH